MNTEPGEIEARNKRARAMLPEPSDWLTEQAILRLALERICRLEVDDDPLASAIAMQDIAYAALQSHPLACTLLAESTPSAINEHAALRAENKRLREALEACANVLSRLKAPTNIQADALDMARFALNPPTA